ncbi:phage antirepressor N-terminal domain-containing protein [Bacteroides intestinalis]|uniref:phage antirepressor N-terminal domain-containing protein n=1 Tax=Bacteroides intestinalis TaxID=329854 RepID=UPI0005CA7833|nr:phage antirepressor N-terminal domain-containing protein [Bacteroides intestinalis]
METKIIARVNNVDIVSTSDEQLVAIKPICEAIGINWEGQRQRIERDEILGSVACIIKATGKDGKTYEMVAVPYMFIFGWLFSIDASKVNENVKGTVIRYKMECYKVLFEHFTEPQTFLKQKQEVMEKKVTEYQECQRRFKDAQKLMNEAKADLNQVMKLTIEDWRANNRQLNLPFSTEEITEE